MLSIWLSILTLCPLKREVVDSYMSKVLFLIHDLHHGGAEKVLVNLVNHMDHKKFNITILALFGGGVNEQFLSPEVRLLHGHSHSIPGNSHIMKLFSPKQLFRHYVKEKYDIIVSYLEGPSARIVSGCPDDGTKLISWTHVEQHTVKVASQAFRDANEAQKCYSRFDKIICVSKDVASDFRSIFQLSNRPEVIYNTINSDEIRLKSSETIDNFFFPENEYKLIGVGKLMPNKGFDRLLHIHERLSKNDHIPVHTFLLGQGAEYNRLDQWVKSRGLADTVTFLGYQKNPYKYVAACDLFVCSSYAEGFSTAATEALIVGTPVITTRVSGMEEMLGDNEYGIITENEEKALYQGIKNMLLIPGRLKHYKQKAQERGMSFNTSQTVRAVENMLESIIEKGL